MDQGTQFHNSINGSDNDKTIVYIETSIKLALSNCHVTFNHPTTLKQSLKTI